MQPISTIQFAVIVPVSILTLYIVWGFVRNKLECKGLPLPPGPTPIPILGNVLSVDRKKPWETYTEWHRIYGDIVYSRLLDQEVVVLGSQSVAVKLLEKRSHIYSDRPFVATLKPYGIDCLFAFSPYGELWRSCRRILHQAYRADTALIHHPMQLRKARQLVISVLDNPDEYEHHYNVFGVSVPLSSSYDYEPDPHGDPIVDAFERFVEAAVPAATPEQAVLLKLFPFLLRIPDWCPGSSLKREANSTRDLSVQLTEMPYRHAKECFETQTTHDHHFVSMVFDHLGRMSEYPDQSQRANYVFNVKKAAVTSILAASETAVSSLMVFTLAMILHPNLLRRAQDEVDTVAGTHRLPDFSDRPAFPFVNAIVRETFRWMPVVPLGVWHATSDSDVYNGQYIPKGATIVANTWAMSRDETRFPNPEEFIPQRFLDEEGMLNENDPMDFIFGFGRRICPGRYSADATLFAGIVTMLATLDIYAAKDAQGNDIIPEVKWINGITHRPEAFPCRMTPRAHVDKAYLERMHAEVNRM